MLEDNLLYQTQLIFSALKNSQKQYYDTKLFCQSYKDNQGKPLDIFQQMDADEFFNAYLDKLEVLLKPSNKQYIIQRIFGGVFCNEVISQGCGHVSEKEEPYLAIGLNVKNKKNVYESLASYVEGETLDGENQYFCDKCEKKVPAIKRVTIKKLPNILMIVLKR